MATITEEANLFPLELEEVDSNCIEIEVDTGDMFILEPLKDHNYISLQPDGPKQNFTKRPSKRIFKRKPKITSLSLLFNCTICGYATTKKEVFTKHQELHSQIAPGTKYVPCKSCNVNRDVPEGYNKCPHCSYYAKNLSSLRVHMHIHNSGTAYKCTECQFYAKDLKELINHLKTAKRYVCQFCTYSSHIQDRVLKHQVKHGDS